MRKANKRPSEWLKLLCKDWAMENLAIVEGTDKEFLDYKPYLKGYLSSQLFCRLSIPPPNKDFAENTPMVDFWGMVGVQDEFDKAYIIAQIERFCSLYNIRGNNNLVDISVDTPHVAATHVDLSYDDHAAAAAAAAASGLQLPSYMTVSIFVFSELTVSLSTLTRLARTILQEAAAAAVAAASDVQKSLTKKQASVSISLC
jgi:hypothetical protein